MNSVIVAHELERCGHLLIGQRPIPVEIVEVAGAILERNFDRLALRLANQPGVDIAAANVGEAADVAEHFAKLLEVAPKRR